MDVQLKAGTAVIASSESQREQEVMKLARALDRMQGLLFKGKA